jgi:demethylmenaquinone methyltransferase/2-methoxy-6-polyprenyl-1,4-benzoquinol methylase
MRRILRPGGKLVILEFSRPANPVFGPVYMWYLHNILPHIGGMISGDAEAYRYLAESIDAFYSPSELGAMMEAAGFQDVRYYPLTMGIVHIHTGIRRG